MTFELSTSELWQEYVLRYNKKLKDLFIQSLTQIRQEAKEETLLEVLKMLPEESKKWDGYFLGTDDSPEVKEYNKGFNSCRSQIKEKLLKLK